MHIFWPRWLLSLFAISFEALLQIGKLQMRKLNIALSSLGGLLGAFMGSWEAFGLQKPWKTHGFLRFLLMQVFGSFMLFVTILGSSSLIPGTIWSQNGFKSGSQHRHKNWSKKCSTAFSKKIRIWSLTTLQTRLQTPCKPCSTSLTELQDMHFLNLFSSIKQLKLDLETHPSPPCTLYFGSRMHLT